MLHVFCSGSFKEASLPICLTPDFQKDLVDELDLAIKRWCRFGPQMMLKFGAMGKQTQMVVG